MFEVIWDYLSGVRVSTTVSRTSKIYTWRSEFHKELPRLNSSIIKEIGSALFLSNLPRKARLLRHIDIHTDRF